MFNDVQKSLLVEARQRIADGNERFLCCAINSAVQSVSEALYDTRWSKAREMKDEIDFGIDGYSCLELWLFSEVGIYPEDIEHDARQVWNKYCFAGWTNPVKREVFENTCRMARMAWVDRALETGTLAS